MDEGLRGLERAAEGGDPAAGAALLAARLRAGLVPRWKVELLAHLDDPVALLVTGRAPAASGGEGWLADRLQGLGGWGQVACVRAGLALARCALAVSGRAPSAGVQAAADWVDCPCQPHLAACALQPRGPIRRLDRFDNLATMVCSPLGPDAAPSARQTLQSLESVLHEARSLVPRAAPDPALAGDRRLWAAVVSELRPWAEALTEPPRRSERRPRTRPPRRLHFPAWPPR